MNGLIFNIQRFSVEDGPGIRTTVFMKGCPLRCGWCHNPESLLTRKELMFMEKRCNKCGICTRICSNNVHLPETKLKNLKSCTKCGKCVEYCPSGALEIIGKRMEIQDVLDEVSRDKEYYNNSGGGVTISGGEPLFQPDFVYNLLKSLKANNIHTALDTSGYSRWNILQSLIKYTDLFLFDLKHIDSKKHKKGTGVSNERIISNFKLLKEKKANITVRFPLIPRFNSDSRSIKSIAEFLCDQKINNIEVIPCHDFALNKYKQLKRSEPNINKPSKGLIDNAKRILEKHGINIYVHD